MENFNDILNGDSVVLVTGETLEVRYVNYSEGFIEVSDEEDTFRKFPHPHEVVRHIPLEG
jgi:hypothetical protein